MKVLGTVCVHLTVKNSCISFPERQAPVSRNDNTGISRSSERYDFLEPVQPSLQIRRSTSCQGRHTCCKNYIGKIQMWVVGLPQNKSFVRRDEN